MKLQRRQRALALSVAISAGTLVFANLAVLTPADTQTVRQPPPSRAVAVGEGEAISRINNWTVGLAGGPIEGAFIWFAADLGTALNDGDNLRVLPTITSGAGDNVKDLVYLKGIDVALTNTDVLEHVRRTSNIANLNNRIHYVAPLFTSDVHIYARPEIKSLADLAGKKVGMHTPGGAASITGPIVFERLGIAAQPVFVNNSIGYEKLKSGEFAAIVHAVAKPNDLFKKIKPEPGYHFLSIPYSDKFDDLYAPSHLTSDDYPHLIPAGERIETIAVGTVLAVYNWPKTSDRFRRVARFVEYFFTRIDTLQKPPFSAKWKDVNLAGKVPGWTRYWYADELLTKMAAGGLPKTSPQPGGADADGTPQETLFREFMDWSRQRQAQAGKEAGSKGRLDEFRAFLDWRKERGGQ